MTRNAPVSLSVYRGLSNKGIGEGPGRPVTRGEQYLDASSPLGGDADLLDAIRLWMTLDSDPADHPKLNDRLEGWSCVIHNGWQLVVRLASAGTFGPRAAYFAHGRIWPSDTGLGFDPGLHMGRSEVFEAPWRDDDPGQLVPEPGEPLLRKDLIEAEPELAALFLAHLLQSGSRRRPLVVLAPLPEFTAGSSLPGLLAFARGALPGDLRRECRVRIYTRTPEHFLRNSGATLIAMPDDLQERALSIRRDVRMIDRQGRLVSGEPIDPVAQAYAEAVLERALRIPVGLTRFGERFRKHRSRVAGLPDERDIRGVQVTYNLAVALAGSAEDRGDLVRSYLPRVAQKLGPDVDWRQLITAEEWQEFPLEPLLGLLFMDTQELPPGMRELQKAVEHSGVLVRAVEQGVLDRSRVRTFLETTPGSRLVAVAHELLRVRGLFGGAWGDSPALLLEGLRRLPSVPRELAPLLLQAGQELNPVTSLPLYLRLADLVARIEGEAGAQYLMAQLWRAFPQISDPGSRELLVEAALSPEWRCLQPRSLVRSGELHASWLETMAPRLVEHQDLLQALGVAALLKLADRLEAQGDLERVFDSVDIHMTGDPQATTDALAWAGWWTAWRKMSRLLVGEPGWRRPAADAWLTSCAWAGEGAREAAKEDWDWVMGQLTPGPSETSQPMPWSPEGGPRRLWPWIPPFEEDQLADLAERAPHIVSLAELAEAVEADPSRPDVGEPSYRYILRRSPFARHFRHDDALGWIMDRKGRGELPPLDLESSFQLWRLAGGLRRNQALRARLASVLHGLETDGQAEVAIDGASEPDLWSSPRFLGGLAAWMNERGSVDRIGIRIAEKIDRRIAGEPDSRPKSVKKKLIKELVKRRLKRAAGLLDSSPPGEVEQESLAESVVDALASQDWRDSCWEELAGKIGGVEGGHPLFLVAALIREEQGERRSLLVRSGWRTFEEAARAHPRLLDFFPDQGNLPVFDLAASLSEPGGLGNAAVGVIYSARQDLRSRPDWWGALLHRLLTWRRYASRDCPEDRRDVAVALVIRLLDGLPLQERQVFWKACDEKRAAHFSE